MTLFLATTVQFRPFTVPIKRYAIRAFVYLIESLQVIVFYRSRPLYIEKAKCDLVLCVRFRKEVLKCAPVEKVKVARVPPVCDSEKDGILFALDLVLYPMFDLVNRTTLSCATSTADSHNPRHQAQWH